MGDFAGAWDDYLPDGVPRNVLKIPRRFQHDWNAFSISEAEKNHATPKASRTCPSTAFRFLAARYALDYTWKFVRVRAPVADVDTRKYSHKLIREKQLSFPELLQQQQKHTQATNSFLNSFNGEYIREGVHQLRGFSVTGSLTVVAHFGKTLFRLHSLGANRAYLWNELRDIRYPSDIQSSWSNVCDTEAPRMRSLIEGLNKAAPKERAPRIKMVAHCCLASRGEEAQYAKIVFIRQHDRWVFVASRALSQEYVYHDIILDNRTSFRVKVLSAVPTQGKQWWSSIHNLIQFHESCYGDPFSTKVTLSPRASKGLSIKYVSIDKVYDAVELHGLRFQLSRKSNSVSLDVRPPKEQLAKKNADESFEFLVTRLVQVLDAFS